MGNEVDFGHLVKIEDIEAYADAGDAPLLREMLDEAKKYLTSHEWCLEIGESYLGLGLGKVLALFLFRMVRAVDGQDEWLWVVVGDVPSAYFVTDSAPDPASALEVYCNLMEDWARAVQEGKDLSKCFPVRKDPTEEQAKMLFNRTKFIREQFVPIALQPPMEHWDKSGQQ